MTIDITNPIQTAIKLGADKPSLIGQTLAVATATADSASHVAQGAQGAATSAQQTASSAQSAADTAQQAALDALQAAGLVSVMVATLSSLLERFPDQIMSMVSAGFVTSDALHTSVEALMSQIVQTADQIQFVLSRSSEQSSLVNDALATVRADLSTLIRMTTGGVEVGAVGNPVKTLIAPDGLHIAVNGVEVAFFKADQQVIDKARILTSLQIGRYVVSPDSTGGVWWRWV